MKASNKARRKLKRRIEAYEAMDQRNFPYALHRPGSQNRKKG